MIKTPWLGTPKSITGLAGFVYLIRNKKTGQKYIGKKFFWSIRYIKKKGQKRRKRIIKESDWRYYRSSSKLVHQEIKEHGIDNFTFIILNVFPTRVQVNYAELEAQVEADVLRARLPDGTWEYYNQNIERKFFKGKL